MSAERIDPGIPEDDTPLPYQLSDGTRHASKEAADAYKAEHYPDEDDDYLASIRSPQLDKVIMGGASAAAILGAISIVVARRHGKDN